jgi:hypothetical protein
MEAGAIHFIRIVKAETRVDIFNLSSILSKPVYLNI